MTHWDGHSKLRFCGRAMTHGEVIAYPTEAVWGLGCDPWNESAVHRILRMKRRDMDKGLIIVAADITQLSGLLTGLPRKAMNTLHRHWPGPTTFLMPHRSLFPECVTGKHDTIAVRVSLHPVIQSLCRITGHPIVSTSANTQGKMPALSRSVVKRYFGDDDILISPGQLGGNLSPSQIIDLQSGTMIRS